MRRVARHVEAPGWCSWHRRPPAPTLRGASLDGFSLGCMAHRLFSGQRPAESVLEMLEKLRAGQGLSDVMDGRGARQHELILGQAASGAAGEQSLEYHLEGRARLAP